MAGCILDRDRALALLEGDVALFREMAALFVTDAPLRLREIDVALDTEDWAGLARAAHTLKGVFGSFAAVDAQGAAARVESAAKSDTAQRAILVELVANLRVATEAVMTLLAAEEHAEHRALHS